MNRRNSKERFYFQRNYTKDNIYLLENGFYICHYINNYLTTESRDAIWNQKVKEDYINGRGKNIINSVYEGYFLNWMVDKRLPKSFFPYFLISDGWIWGVLTIPSYYKDYKKLYNEKIVFPQIVNQPENIEIIIN